MEVPHKGGYGIVNYNHRRTYCPLVPKRDTFYVTDGSPQFLSVLYEGGGQLNLSGVFTSKNLGVLKTAIFGDFETVN